ncbi:MAG: DNA-binding protein, partial [Actinobacteria bacterium]|nr:DNA-binding protein [Actinomycetota bacterium]
AKKTPAIKPAAKAPAKSIAQPTKPVPPAAPVVPPAPPVQVINPIGGAIPTVRKAVPGKKAAPKHPVVQEDESNWTKTEINQVRKILEREAAELISEIAVFEENFHSLIVESGEGAGDDQADAGTKTFEREQEISLLSNKQDLLDQTRHALDRIEQGTYGRCENCGRQIGKLRLIEANPRATLCMPCREREDRS